MTSVFIVFRLFVRGLHVKYYYATSPFISFEADKLFPDVDESMWSYADIKKACNLGLIRGDGEGRFNPTGNLKREQAVVLMVRLYEKILKDMEER